jgi:hypothetical protein
LGLVDGRWTVRAGLGFQYRDQDLEAMWCGFVGGRALCGLVRGSPRRRCVESMRRRVTALSVLGEYVARAASKSTVQNVVHAALRWMVQGFV